MDAAATLFYREGITATGVDRIAAVAGVGKMSIYRHFAGKDDLVVEVLRKRDAPHLDWLLPMASPGEQQVLAVFDRIATAARRPGYQGCPFVRAALELPVDHPGRSVVVEHKRRLAERIEHHLRAFGLPAARDAAGVWVTLIDGAATECAVQRSALPARHARDLAEIAVATGDLGR
jgi:AcrR family transcriptional regulator